VINDSRDTMTCECEWSLALSRPLGGRKKVSVRAGDQKRIPLSFVLPEKLAAGSYRLTATARFDNGETQIDTFTIHVLPHPADLPTSAKIAVLDRKGETTKRLMGLGIRFEKVEAHADLSRFQVLIVGKEALAIDGPELDVGRVRDGLKVIVFEQSARVLEER